MMENRNEQIAAASGVFAIGGDLPVSRLGFGAMRLTGEGIWGPPKDKDAAIAVLKRAWDLGITLIDTAEAYGPEISESLIAEALYPYPKGLVIATKGGLLRTGPNQFRPDGRPQRLRQDLEGSLRRLRVDQIDVYQLHYPDPNVPFEDSVGEIAKMKAEGKIRHVGLSNVTIDQLTAAQKIVPIVTVQNHYNLEQPQAVGIDIQQTAALIDLCAQENIGFIPWHPRSVGDLARPGSVLDQIARRYNAQSSQIALAWLLKRSPTILPIPGTASVKHFEENVEAAKIRLSQDEFEAIRRVAHA
ncbi:oxidoreductase [Ktedonobacter sp. SOSP1-85]|uniref:aldo/keto reductase n=1 Tax=Ktedonobacter sp. SOSP1-85 TaxID=2778367 RepID=UPI001A2CAB07|nr:aldo/keto reductase [Ktedonobacter sp. SOSP1-85]GHO76878.1 oxidoreductase [Ktedonobacter sp. SOSP1-85]